MTKHQMLMGFYALLAVGMVVYGAVSQDWSGVPVALASLFGEGSKHGV